MIFGHTLMIKYAITNPHQKCSTCGPFIVCLKDLQHWVVQEIFR